MERSVLHVHKQDNRPSTPKWMEELQSKGVDNAVILAVYKEKRRIIDALQDRVQKTGNTYFTIEQLKKIISGR